MQSEITPGSSSFPSCSSNYTPCFSFIFFPGPQTAPTNSGPPGESKNALRKGKLQCGCKGRWRTPQVATHTPLFLLRYQNYRLHLWFTAALSYLSLECTRNIWQKTKAESQNCGQSLLSHPWNLLPIKSAVPPMSLPDDKQGLSQRKDLPDLQGIWDFLLPFNIRH